MVEQYFTDSVAGAQGLLLVEAGRVEGFKSHRRLMDLLARQGFFHAKAGQCFIGDAKPYHIIYVYEDGGAPLAFGGLARQLPAGDYAPSFYGVRRGKVSQNLWLGFLLGAYDFRKYRNDKEKKKSVRLVRETAGDGAVAGQFMETCRIAEAVFLTRDLINEPPNMLTTTQFSDIAHKIAVEHNAQFKEYLGDSLRQEFPLVYNVGKGSSSPPCVVVLDWGKEDDPRVALVGKGVCFDSGGLDLKTSAGMAIMKKDMGGGAHALALGQLIMAMGLRVRLKIILGLVENMPDGNAFRVSDIIKSRSGIQVEIGNTDAEGRLVLADCLALAGEWVPHYMINFATLTGAARVAVGTEIAAYFCNDEGMAKDLERESGRYFDPIWRLPLYQPYRKILKSVVADLGSTGNSPYAGSIVAALFLQEFVQKTIKWAHFDIMAWNVGDSAGKPAGGEAMGLRAVYGFVKSIVK